MKYRNHACVAALGAVLLGSLFFAGRTESAAPDDATAPAKWEYAYLLNTRTQLKSGFNTPTGSVSAEDAFSLYQKLGGHKRQSEFTLADLMTHVGGQGWELVSVDTQDSVAATYWFKRAAE